MITVTCLQCNKTFEAKRSTAKFCTDNCRVKFNNRPEQVKQETKLVVEKTGLKEKPSDEKMEKLRAVMDKINKDLGAGTVMMLGDKPPIYTDVISTGSIGLDNAIGIGGLPRGRMIEIYGQNGCGKTTIAIHIMINAQKKGLKCLLVDAENTFDPEYAEAVGLNVNDLIYCQPLSAEHALETVNRHIASGEIGLAVIDSIAALVPQAELEGQAGDSRMGLMARLMSQACRKMTGNIARTNTICLFINQLRQQIGNMYVPFVTTGGMALGYYASIRLDVTKLAQIKDGEVSLGNRTRVKVVKNKCAAPFKTTEFDIIFGEGIDRTGEIIDMGANMGIMHKSGSWFYYKESKLGQGKEQVRAVLKENPKTTKEIEIKILENLKRK